VSGWPHSPAALPPEEPLVPILHVAGWPAELDWTFWRTDKSLSPTRIRWQILPARSPVTILTVLSRLFDMATNQMCFWSSPILNSVTLSPTVFARRRTKEDRVQWWPWRLTLVFWWLCKQRSVYYLRVKYQCISLASNI
jgi:hypothetical protein